MITDKWIDKLIDLLKLFGKYWLGDPFDILLYIIKFNNLFDIHKCCTCNIKFLVRYHINPSLLILWFGDIPNLKMCFLCNLGLNIGICCVHVLQ